MKAGSFRDSVTKTVRMLTRDQVQVVFRGFQPMVVAGPDGKVKRMVLPEINDNAPEGLIEAMQGFLDHECGHIFFTDFKRSIEALKGLPRGAAKMRAAFDNIVEDIRLEKLLPRELPGTKDNLERMYEAVMDDFFGKSIQEALANNAPPEKMMGVCIVVGFRALAGQKAFMRYMDTHNLWQFITPLTSRMPTLAKELQTMETYDDVQRIVDMILNSMTPQSRQQAEEAFEQLPDMTCSGDGDNDQSEGDHEPDESDESDEGKSEKQEKPKKDDKGDSDDADSGDAGDDEGNSSEGDEADEGEGGAGDDEADQDSGETGDDSADADGSSGGDEKSDDEGDGKDGDESEDKSDDTGGEGHGDGEGTDDGSDEEGGDCSGDDEGGDDTGDGEGEDEGDSETGGDDEGNTHRSITDALKQLEPTQRQVLYLHKNKRRSIQRIAEKMNMTEDEVKATLRDARRNLADLYMGSN
jgi:hypothetical protein